MVVVYDLDDTLYDEVDFVKSGFKEVANYLSNRDYYYYMYDTFLNMGSGKVFNKLIEKYNLEVSIEKLVEIYKFHKPNIKLNHHTIELLNFTKKYRTALISDGHYIMQKNKFDALDLKKYIKFTIFTDFYHTKKPENLSFEMVMNKYKNEDKFIYISDNPSKDFIAPNKLGWLSIRYKNKRGIYKNFKNNATFEVNDRLAIISILKDLSK
ncbi:MAG: HAD family hydrolase [Campylobacteraceae bacterium]